MKTEIKILITGLAFATVTSLAVFFPWTEYFSLAKLGEFGHFISNDFYNCFIGIVVIYMIVLALKYKEFKGIFWQGCIILAILTVFHIGLKLLIGDFTPRPSGNSGGFPSGHSQAVFALAFLMSVRNGKLTFPAFVLASLMAWSRIFSAHFEPGEAYEPAHYPYQVCFGSFFGVVLTYIMFIFSEKIRKG